jgi:hypothetical protein
VAVQPLVLLSQVYLIIPIRGLHLLQQKKNCLMASPAGLGKREFTVITVEDNAPVTKGIMGLTVATSVLTSIFNLRHLLSLSRFSLLRWELWRVFTHHFFFAETGELLTGLLLVYNFRLFERLMGSKKFFVQPLGSLVLIQRFLLYLPWSCLHYWKYQF